MSDVVTASIAREPLPPNVRTLWRVGACATALAVGITVAFVGAAVGGAVAALVGGAAAGVVGATGWVIADLRYRAWRWGLDERWLETRQGVIVRTTQVLPRTRVQTLTTRTGPLDRWLGLTTVVVHTAGTHTPNLTIPHVDAEAVARLQRELGG